MPKNVAAIVLPSILNTPNRRNDQQGFPGQAESIVTRNQRKHDADDRLAPLGRNAGGGARPRQAIFSSGPDANVTGAFQALGKSGIGSLQKVYVLVHGNEQGIENPELKGGTATRMKASELANKFMDDAGLRQAILDKLRVAAARGGRESFEISIRLLACRTGCEPEPVGASYESKSATTYLHDFGNMLGREIAKTMAALAKEHPEKYLDASLSVKVSLAAPRGWSAITHEGQAIAYDASPEAEPAADAAVASAFQAAQDKAQIYANQKAKPYLLSEDDKKQNLTLLVQKYAGSRQLSGEVV